MNPADGASRRDGAASSSTKVIYLGDLHDYSRALMRFEALADLGHTVLPIESTVVRLDPEGRAVRWPLYRRILHKLGLNFDPVGANRALVKAARSFAPDVIWIDKGTTVDRRTLRLARQAAPGVRIVNVSEDDMALAHNQTPRWRRALPEYDLVITTKIHNIANGELERLGARRVFYTRQAFDPRRHVPIALDNAERDRYRSDVLFIGIYEAQRAASILALCRAGIRVHVWGTGWTRPELTHPLLTLNRHDALNLGDNLVYSKALSGARIALAFLRKLNRDQHTSRSLEIPACGALLLGERTEEHQAMFREGVEADFFSGDAELVTKTRAYLADEDRRRAVADAGHRRCVAAFSTTDQVRNIIAALRLDEGAAK